MFKNIWPYPIVPTSEADTLSFLQKLEYLGYQIDKAVKRVDEFEALVTPMLSDIDTLKANVSDIYIDLGTLSSTATVMAAEISDLEGEAASLTNDVTGLRLNLAALSGTVAGLSGAIENLSDDVSAIPIVSVTGVQGVAQSITVDNVTYTIPQGGSGTAYPTGRGNIYEGGSTPGTLPFSWTNINGTLMVTFDNVDTVFNTSLFNIAFTALNAGTTGGSTSFPATVYVTSATGTVKVEFKAVISWFVDGSGTVSGVLTIIDMFKNPNDAAVTFQAAISALKGATVFIRIP